MHGFGVWNSVGLSQPSGSQGSPGGSFAASVAPIGGGPGGFPGIFPGGGVSNSGFAGLRELQARQRHSQQFTYGPPRGLLGPRR